MMKTLSVLFSAVLFCGCSIFNPYNDEYLCRGKAQTGKCLDMGQAYEAGHNADTSLVITEHEPRALSDSEQKYLSAVLENQAQRIQVSPSPVLKRPKVMRMLMLDYTDQDTLFGSRYIWFLNDKPEWAVPLAVPGEYK